MKVGVVIPVYNEANKLPRSLSILSHFLSQHFPFDYELIIADNGSTDRTLEIAQALRQQYPALKVLHFDQKGRGGALKAAWLASNADILSYMDVDLSTDLSAFPNLCRALIDQQFDLAIGSRLLPQSRTTRCFRRERLSRVYNRLLQVLLQVHFSDAQCGFKAITRSAALQLLPLVDDTHWFFDTELLVLAEKFGYRLCEIPVTWVENPDSRVRIFQTILQDLKGIIRLKRHLQKGKYDLQIFHQSKPAKAC